MVETKDITILVVTHNHAQYLPALIQSLENFGYSNVFFCEANSSDNTRCILESSSFASNVLIKNKLEGFSKNNNDLIRHFHLNSSFYLLLNPDVYFDMDFLGEMLKVIEDDRSIGIVAPQMFYPDGSIQVSWKYFPNFFTVLKKRMGLLKASEERFHNGPEIDWCLGACMLINSNLMKNNNALLDERYRLYCEDIDICTEAHYKGLKVIGTKMAKVFHHLNESSSKNIFSRYNLWNLMSIAKFILKWNWFYFRVRKISERKLL